MEKEIPQRPETLSYQYEKSGDSLILRKKESLGAVVFMMVWLTFWTVGCVMLTWHVVAELSFFNFCFVGAFWGGWIAGFATLMGILFGRKTAWLDRGGLSSEFRVLFWMSSRYVPLGEIRYFHAKMEKAKDSDSSDKHVVETVTDGKPVEFSAANFEEARWLAFEMNRMLEVLKGVAVEDVAEEDQKPMVIPWNSRPRGVEPPEDCRWEVNADGGSVMFEKRGRFSWHWLTGLAGITLFMLFWNSILSVFIMALLGFLPPTEGKELVLFSWEWWLLFVFLIPFELVGLLLIWGWLYVLFSPFERVRWSVGRYEAVCSVRWFDIGRSWWYSLETCREMVIDMREAERKPKGVKISFVGFEGETLCEMKELTKDEAKWMADNILGWR